MDNCDRLTVREIDLSYITNFYKFSARTEIRYKILAFYLGI